MRLWRFFIALTVTGIAALPAHAASVIHDSQTSIAQFNNFAKVFWDAEKQLQQRDDSFSLHKPIYRSPLSKGDPLYQKYFSASNLANTYIESIDGINSDSWTLPPALYLGGLAAFTVGDYTNAQKYFSRLLTDHPNYQRDLYINDRYSPNPDFAQPIKPGITKLLFYCQIVEAASRRLKKRQDAASAFTDFQQFNQTALKVLSTQEDFSYWLEHRPYRSLRRTFWNETYGETPDQMRATVLPKTSQLIKQGWEGLFPTALKKSGVLKMRAYLRQFFGRCIAARCNCAASGGCGSNGDKALFCAGKSTFSKA